LAAGEGGKDFTLRGETFRALCREEYEEDREDDGEGAVGAVTVRAWGGLNVSLRRYVKAAEEDRRPAGKIKIASFLPELPVEAEAALEEAVTAKHKDRWDFERAVEERALENYVRSAAAAGKEPRAAVIDWYFKHTYSDTGRVKKLYAVYTGKKFTSYSRAFKETGAAAVFFILGASGLLYDLPGLEEMNDPERMKGNGFMKFSGLTAEEYRWFFREAARQLAAEAEAEAGAL
jgi:hypothetical protein